jgi:K+-sensing histidine kinase KdpD
MVDLLEAQAQEIKALQRAVRNLEGRLEVLVQLDVMVANQLRDPLDAIEDTLGWLCNQDDSADWQAPVEEALGQTRSVIGMVSELVTPQEIGPAPVERSRLVTVPLDGLVEQALTVVSTTLDRGLVEVDLPPGFMITTAPRRLVGILVSLFENAAACAGSGPVTCRGEVTDGVLSVEVADSGPGLASVDVEKLFEPHSEDDDQCGGTRSAGMYLVRMLARSLGGEATIADRPGGGAVARVQIPQRRDGDIRLVPAVQRALDRHA